MVTKALLSLSRTLQCIWFGCKTEAFVPKSRSENEGEKIRKIEASQIWELSLPNAAGSSIFHTVSLISDNAGIIVPPPLDLYCRSDMSVVMPILMSYFLPEIWLWLGRPICPQLHFILQKGIITLWIIAKASVCLGIMDWDWDCWGEPRFGTSALNTVNKTDFLAERELFNPETELSSTVRRRKARRGRLTWCLFALLYFLERL